MARLRRRKEPVDFDQGGPVPGALVAKLTTDLSEGRAREIPTAAALRLYLEANVHGFDLALRFGALMLAAAAAALYFFLLVNIDHHHLGQHDEVAFAY